MPNAVSHTFPTATFNDGVLDKSTVVPPPPAPNAPKWKGPLLQEDWEARQASFGGVDFWVQRGSDTEPVRVGEYNRPYQRGADLEPMGQDPRQTSVSALLVKTQVKTLQRLRDAQVPMTYRDPTLGSYTALLVDVSVSWDAQKLNFYQAELTFKRQGAQAAATIPKVVQSTYDAASAQAAAIVAVVTEISAKPDWDAAIASAPSVGQATTASTAWGASWSTFDAALQAEVDAAPDPAIGKNEIARAADSLTRAGNDLVESLEQVAAESAGLLAETEAAAYSFRDMIATLNALALDAVLALASEPTAWAEIMITEPVDIAVFCQAKLGAVSESIVASIMEADQGGWTLDPFLMPAGLVVRIPVNLDEFA